MKQIIYMAPAKEEMIEAAEYYERQSRNLGRDFLSEVRKALERIRQNPFAWQKVDGNIRRCLVSRFPYGVLYEPKTDKIVVVAIMHLHRRPEYWKYRL